MTQIVFKTKTPDVLPTDNKDTRGISDFYFAKIETVSGEISKAIVCYDFNYSKWRFISSGGKRIIEYYV